MLDAVFKTTWNVLGGALHHVLWIDEANNLKDLLGMEGGEKALKQVLDAFVRWTKQEKLVTIVLSSSESFYLNNLYRETFGTSGFFTLRDRFLFPMLTCL